MLHQTPRQSPPLGMMLDDLGNPSTSEVCKHLGVSSYQLGGWIRKNQAPRSILLSLFWCTRWGRSILDAQAVNDARLYAGLAECR